MKNEKIDKNLICPHCNKPLTKKSFYGGKWQCRKCGKLLDFETYRKFFPMAKMVEIEQFDKKD